MTNSAAESDGPIAILAGHGDFAAGMISAVAQITGRSDRLLAFSNRDLAPADIERALRDAVAAHPVRVLFTDLPGGSCTMAARRLLRDRPDLVLVTGTNLPTLLDFVLCADCTPEEEGRTVASQAVEKGRAALAAAPAPATPAGASAPSGAEARGAG